jgi:hypothetical protein
MSPPRNTSSADFEKKLNLNDHNKIKQVNAQNAFQSITDIMKDFFNKAI